MEINKIYNEDCIKTMKNRIDNESIDAVLTSPPYNIIRPSLKDRGYDEYKDGMSNDEYSAWIVGLFIEFDRILKKDGIVIWNMSYGCENTECMNLTIADIVRKTNFTIADIIIWKKQSATPNNVSKNKLTRICEFVYVFCRKSEFMTFNMNKEIVGYRNDTNQTIYKNYFNFIECPNNDESNNLNKATFSSNFVQKLLNLYCKKGWLIYDCFMGTGTTALGCHRLRMNYIGSEISKKQCEYAEERIKNEKMQTSIFDFIND